jgi:hypothetical protein
MHGVLITCPNGHEQRFDMDNYAVADARMMAELLDGTSDILAGLPESSDRLGKCGICGARITSTLYGFEETADNQPHEES